MAVAAGTARVPPGRRCASGSADAGKARPADDRGAACRWQSCLQLYVPMNSRKREPQRQKKTIVQQALGGAATVHYIWRLLDGVERRHASSARLLCLARTEVAEMPSTEQQRPMRSML